MGGKLTTRFVGQEGFEIFFFFFFAAAAGERFLIPANRAKNARAAHGAVAQELRAADALRVINFRFSAASSTPASLGVPVPGGPGP